MNDFRLSGDDRRAIAEAQRVLSPQALANIQSALALFAERQRELVAAATPGIQRALEQVAGALAMVQPRIDQITDQFRSTLVALQPGLAALAEEIERVVPANLRHRFDELDALWAMAVEDGVAICWVPRSGLLDDLLAEPTREARMDVLVSRRVEIFADCLDVLAAVRSPGATACREAIAAAADGHHGAAQSLAGNVIDSFVLASVDGRHTERRRRATEWASEGYGEDDALRDLFDVVALAPIVAAFESWWPGDEPPQRFNRHATAHAAGEEAVYSERFSMAALIAAVSITRHFHNHSPELVPLGQRVIDQADVEALTQQ